MTKVESEMTSLAHASNAEDDRSRDKLYGIYSNRRYQYVLHCLRQRDSGYVAMSTLATQIATWENNGERRETEITADGRRHVYTALKQFHHLGAMMVIEQLHEAVAWLPVDEINFGPAFGRRIIVSFANTSTLRSLRNPQMPTSVMMAYD